MRADTVEAICYSCFDQIQFQFFGQTKKYWAEQRERETTFIKSYDDLGRPLIKCDVCGQLVKYVRSEDGKWTEERDDA